MLFHFKTLADQFRKSIGKLFASIRGNITKYVQFLVENAGNSTTKA